MLSKEKQVPVLIWKNLLSHFLNSILVHCYSNHRHVESDTLDHTNYKIEAVLHCICSSVERLIKQSPINLNGTKGGLTWPHPSTTAIKRIKEFFVKPLSYSLNFLTQNNKLTQSLLRTWIAVTHSCTSWSVTAWKILSLDGDISCKQNKIN